ncbi:MAG: hypothetical protein KDN18_18850 [Verrucomicrobiae bacterium]|nr:hypothetical protein [Verrucomicrobiae bacterium]
MKRGSAKHLLDLLESNRCLETLNALIADGSASIQSDDCWQPFGKANRDEWREMEIPAFCDQYFDELANHPDLKNWWLPPQTDGRTRKGATWDLLSTCTIEGRAGLLLVEAKAHEDELEYGGKPMSLAANVQSKLNHEHIRKNLREVSDKLNQAADGVFALSIDSHYQLANRIAWAWKLADCGVPVVLLYLGFLGDTYFRSDYLKDADHWQRIMGAYLHGVVPKALPGRPVAGQNGGTFTLLVKSLPIREVSSK